MNEDMRKILFTIRRIMQTRDREDAQMKLGIAFEILYAFGYILSSEYDRHRFTLYGKDWKYEETIDVS